MILSVSRRTDIPSFYTDWFFNRLEDGYVYVRNPMSIHQISKVELNPSVIDGIVFWTKNPSPMMDRLEELDKKGYMYYFQFTVTSYGEEIEKKLPSKKDVIIPTFKKLSKIIGKERVIWRYDPILLTEKYSIECHKNSFEYLAKALSGYTNKCVISFLDLYKKIQSNMKPLNLLPLGIDEMNNLAKSLADIAKKYEITLESCSEKIDLDKYGIKHGHCIDAHLFEEILGCKLNIDKDKNQRLECGCASSIDIGLYNTCRNHCIYCYANFSQNVVDRNSFAHNPDSPLISGNVMPDDNITERKVKSLKDDQISMF